MKDLFKSILLCYLIVAGTVLPFSSFKGDCQHVFVEIKKAIVQRHCHINQHPMLENLEIGRTWKEPVIGSHQQEHDKNNIGEGIAIVCIKCHVEGKQKVHYTHDE